MDSAKWRKTEMSAEAESVKAKNVQFLKILSSQNRFFIKIQKEKTQDLKNTGLRGKKTLWLKKVPKRLRSSRPEFVQLH